MLPDITVYVGVYTPLVIDLTGFDFTGVSSVVWSVKNFPEDEKYILQRTYTASDCYQEEVTPKESMELNSLAVYDFTIITADGKMYVGENCGRIRAVKGVGEYVTEHE